MEAEVQKKVGKQMLPYNKEIIFFALPEAQLEQMDPSFPPENSDQTWDWLTSVASSTLRNYDKLAAEGKEERM